MKLKAAPLYKCSTKWFKSNMINPVTISSTTNRVQSGWTQTLVNFTHKDSLIHKRVCNALQSLRLNAKPSSVLWWNNNVLKPHSSQLEIPEATSINTRLVVKTTQRTKIGTRKMTKWSTKVIITITCKETTMTTPSNLRKTTKPKMQVLPVHPTMTWTAMKPTQMKALTLLKVFERLNTTKLSETKDIISASSTVRKELNRQTM